jgi:hypothetical protein
MVGNNTCRVVTATRRRYSKSSSDFGRAKRTSRSKRIAFRRPTDTQKASSIRQYGTINGETLVRYDNFPDHPGVAKHHKHTADGSVESIDFEGVRSLFERFKTEVPNHGENWP